MMNSFCRRVHGLLEREVDGEILLLDTESDLIHQLNKTASFIWRQSQEGASSGDIAEMLAKNFSVEEHTAKADVEAIIGQLRALRIVRSPADLKAQSEENQNED
jgi:Coenzyme PQQ synthesis protein D (PqqD)